MKYPILVKAVKETMKDQEPPELPDTDQTLECVRRVSVCVYYGGITTTIMKWVAPPFSGSSTTWKFEFLIGIYRLQPNKQNNKKQKYALRTKGVLL